MIRLALSDLRDHAATWVGAFFVAIACGCIGGWIAFLQSTAGSYADPLRTALQNAGSMMLVFSLVAAVAVLASAANLTVSAQRRSYALWQLANVKPRMVSAVVLVQLAVVAIAGAVCGTLLAALSFEPLFPLVFGSRDEIAQLTPYAELSFLPRVWLVVAGVFLCGGLRGARAAGRTPPLAVLREPEPKRMGMTWLRAAAFACLVVCTCWMGSILIGSGVDEAFTWSIFMPPLVVATLVPVAPLVLSALLRAWTSLVPQKRWIAWYLARRAARFGLAASSSVETPVMVGFGLVSGVFSVVAGGVAFLKDQGVTDASGLDASAALLMLGGPVLLCAVGAAVSVVMSSRSRSRDVALLSAVGARPETLVAAAVCEAFIHTVTATLTGAVATIAAGAIVNYAYGWPFFAGLTFGEGLVVSFAGFALVLAATLVPTCMALGQDAAVVIVATQE